MAEGNLLFQPVKNYFRHEVVTCRPADSILQVAARMREHNISSVVICEESQPLGIVTDRDLR
ncbi:MAG: signal transduction protein, partial [Desulfuromonas sp.]